MLASRRRSTATAALLVAAAGAGAFWLLRGEPPAEHAPPKPSRLAFEPSAEQRQTMATLRARVSKDNPRFAAEDANQKANAKLFTYMAETSEEEHVVLASLDAIQSAYSSRSARKESPDRDLDQVLLRHVRAERPSVALAAFTAARVPLMMVEPSPELTRGIVELALPTEPPARRQAALEALDLLRPDRRDSHVLAALEQALSATEPHLVSTGLLALSHSAPAIAALPIERVDALAKRVSELVRDPDPGVAGRALAVLAEVEPLLDADTRLRTALEQLRHPHAYVRAQAVDLSVRCGQASAIHALIELVGDRAPAQYELVGWARLDGSPGALSHVVPARRSVAEAALYAVASLSRRAEGAQPLSLTLGGPQRSDERLQENAELARAWYRGSSSRIPRQGVGCVGCERK